MWFEPGLTKERLAQEYKKLVKRWHPDVNQDNVEEATKNMQEINNEYDQYFVRISYDETGYNAEDLFDLYKRAREERRIILAFLKRDRETGGWFSFNKYGKVVSDSSEAWRNFHGGFALCQLKADVETFHNGFSWRTSKYVTNQQVSKLSSNIETPTYGDMYFASKWGGFSDVMDISLTTHGKNAHVSSYATFSKIHTEKYGDIWIARSARRGYDSYMKVNGQVMSCPFDLNPKFYEIIETVSGKDFGFLQFQNCTAEDFTEHFDVFYTPKFSESLNCRRLGKDELYFIDDPIVAHYARTGIVAFYCAERNFRMRYGKFTSAIFDNIHLLSYDDADYIQDYLDKMNVEFEESIKRMVKSGKIKINI